MVRSANRLAWIAIGANLIAILLGAIVRATHSGAGCGRSWPTCQGSLIPELAGATTIEYVHRFASGVALATVAVVAIRVFRVFPTRHRARRAVTWAAAAAGGEALIGAAIVLYEWVGSDDSAARVISVPLHLVNTLLLLAALTLTAWFTAGGDRLGGRRGRGWLALGAVALVLIFASGAVTALADTLFPISGLGDAPTAHFLTRLRVIHPFLGLTTVLAALLAARGAGAGRPGLARPLLGLAVLQLGLGGLNILLATPVWLQILHLALADAIWIAYVWMGAQVLASDSASSPAPSTGARQVNPLQR